MPGRRGAGAPKHAVDGGNFEPCLGSIPNEDFQAHVTVGAHLKCFGLDAKRERGSIAGLCGDADRLTATDDQRADANRRRNSRSGPSPSSHRSELNRRIDSRPRRASQPAPTRSCACVAIAPCAIAFVSRVPSTNLESRGRSKFEEGAEVRGTIGNVQRDRSVTPQGMAEPSTSKSLSLPSGSEP